ncbi:MAG: metallophosphoesterase [Micavibrio sp.]
MLHRFLMYDLPSRIFNRKEYRVLPYLKSLSTGDTITLIILLICLIIGVYGSFIEPFRLKVTRWDVRTEKWTYQRELKIAVLTDMHMIWPWMTRKHLMKAVEKANSLQPDIIVLLGDYVATHPFGIQLNPEKSLEPLKKLSARCGVYAVLGNHDLHPRSSWPEALKATDIPVLINQSLPVDCDGEKFWIAGLDELWWGKADIKKTLEGVENDSPVLLMMHNPDSFPDVPENVALSMAGHTHGGQIRFPFIGSLSIVVPSKYGNRYAYGHVKEGNKDIVISSGIGMTGIPLRLFNPPEVGLIVLSGTEH